MFSRSDLPVQLTDLGAGSPSLSDISWPLCVSKWRAIRLLQFVFLFGAQTARTEPLPALAPKLLDSATKEPAQALLRTMGPQYAARNCTPCTSADATLAITVTAARVRMRARHVITTPTNVLLAVNRV